MATQKVNIKFKENKRFKGDFVLNEFDRFKIKREGVKEQEFLRAFNNATDEIRRIILVCLGLHDSMNSEEKECVVYDFDKYWKKKKEVKNDEIVK